MRRRHRRLRGLAGPARRGRGLRPGRETDARWRGRRRIAAPGPRTAAPSAPSGVRVLDRRGRRTAVRTRGRRHSAGRTRGRRQRAERRCDRRRRPIESARGAGACFPLRGDACGCCPHASAARGAAAVHAARATRAWRRAGDRAIARDSRRRSPMARAIHGRRGRRRRLRIRARDRGIARRNRTAGLRADDLVPAVDVTRRLRHRGRSAALPHLSGVSGKRARGRSPVGVPRARAVESRRTPARGGVPGVRHGTGSGKSHGHAVAPLDVGRGAPSASRLPSHGDVTRRRTVAAFGESRPRPVGAAAVPVHGVLMRVIAVPEVAARHRRPGRVVMAVIMAGVIRGSDVVVADREHRAVVPAERAPAHVARGVAPRYVRRGPVRRRNPEPGVRREPPAAVVMRRVAERISGDPGVAVRRIGRPAAVVIRTPAGRHARIPDVPVGRLILPVAVLIERRRVAGHVLRQVLRRLARRRVDGAALHL